MIDEILAKEWWRNPEWIGILTNLGALTAGIVAAVVAYRLFKVEQRRDTLLIEQMTAASEERAKAERERQDRQEDHRRAQANLVSAWSGIGPKPLFDLPHTRNPSEVSQRVPGAFVRNASSLPVHRVDVTFHYIGMDSQRHTVRHEWKGARVIAPLDYPSFIPFPDHPNPRMANNRVGELAVSISFDDAADNRWARDQYGTLSEVEAPPERP